MIRIDHEMTKLHYISFIAATSTDSISEYTWLGPLGEAYSPVMAILPMAYRVWQSPETLYDGMIYISKAHPTKIMPEQ